MRRKVSRKIDVRKDQAAFDFPQASSSPPKPKTDHKGRKQILSRRESARILGIQYKGDDEYDG
jgi:hypothetical protein